MVTTTCRRLLTHTALLPALGALLMFGSFHSACPKACPTAGRPINPAVPASGWRVTWFSTGTTHRHASTGNQAFYYYLMKMQKLSQIFQTIFIPLINLHTVWSKAFFFCTQMTVYSYPQTSVFQGGRIELKLVH